MLSKGDTYTLIGYDVRSKQLFVDRTHSGIVRFSQDFPSRTAAPLSPVNGKLRLRILVDRNSVEVFGADGHVALTNLVFPEEDAYGTEVYSDDEGISAKLDVWTLRSIWSRKAGQ